VRNESVGKLLKTILEKFEENLKFLEINGEISMGNLNIILKNFKNLECLNLYNLDVEIEHISPAANICPNLKSFKCSRGAIQAFQIVKNCDKLKTMRAEQYRPEHLNIPKFQDFLLSQKCLKHLELLNLRNTSLFENAADKKVNFQLETLKIQNFLPRSNKDFFLTFLNGQKNLDSFTVEYDCLPPPGLFDDLFIFVFNSPKLKTLKIYSYQQIGLLNYSIFSTINPNIENFYFSMINGTPLTPPGLLLEMFSRVMPGLKKFDFYLLPLIVTKDDIMCLNTLEKLEDLSINSCKKDVITYLNFPNLKSLRLHFEDRLVANLISEDWNVFFKNHPKIKTLKLYDELNEKILVQMTKSLPKLEHLEMEIFSAITAKIVVENCKNLKYCKFYIKENSTAKDDICHYFETACYDVKPEFDSVLAKRVL
jgi:hypothetical protein